MSSNTDNASARLPSVDAILRWPHVASLIERYGRSATTDVTPHRSGRLPKRIAQQTKPANRREYSQLGD